MRRFGLLFVLFLSACTTSDADRPIGEVVPPPGRYQNAQAWFQGELGSAMRENRPSPKLTDKVAADFTDCVWSYLKLGFTPAVMADLDAYARGERAMSNDAKAAMQREAELFRQQSKGDFSKLRPYCPDKISEFEAAVRW
jgi:hypothetical protein